MDIDDLKTVKTFLKRYKDELPIGCNAYDELLSFVKTMIKGEDGCVHMDDDALRSFVSDNVDEYFQKNNKTIDPFKNGNPESVSDEEIEARKRVIVEEIKDHMDDGKRIFVHYLGGSCAISPEYWSFK